PVDDVASALARSERRWNSERVDVCPGQFAGDSVAARSVRIPWDLDVAIGLAWRHIRTKDAGQIDIAAARLRESKGRAGLERLDPAQVPVTRQPIDHVGAIRQKFSPAAYWQRVGGVGDPPMRHIVIRPALFESPVIKCRAAGGAVAAGFVDRLAPG